MRSIKQFFLCFLLTTGLASAADSKFTFEPIYGVETSMVRYPEPSRYVSRATYGVRMLYGLTIFSGELELTQAKSREDYPGTDQKVEDTSDRASLGFRSTFGIGQYFGFYFRAGGRASQGKTKITTAGVEETKDNPLRLDPFAGTGIQLAFAANLGLNAGVTLVRNGENKYDTQYTLGLSARFGNR
jgi:hypothetical protein